MKAVPKKKAQIPTFVPISYSDQTKDIIRTNQVFCGMKYDMEQITFLTIIFDAPIKRIQQHPSPKNIIFAQFI